ncbi:MAG: glycerophosphodiester phosphodiesterase family protein [Candidatus Woesearchaeota archaeon]
MLPLKEYVKQNKVIIVAHRGSSGTAPENTLSAYRQAFEEGAQMLEIDLQLTKDGEIIALHDKSTIKSLLNSKNKGLYYKDIKDLDIGSSFSDNFKGEKIPRLIDILEIAKDKIYLMIEVKPNKKRNYKNELELINNLLLKTQTIEQVIIGSFDYKVIKNAKQLNPNISTAAIKIPMIPLLPSIAVKKYDCQAFICSIKELNEKISKDAITNNIYLGAYSIDNKKDLKKAIKYNVKAIATNYPAKILSLLNSEEFKEIE